MLFRKLGKTWDNDVWKTKWNYVANYQYILQEDWDKDAPPTGR